MDPMAPTTPHDDEQRREALAQWMNANGVEPATVLRSEFRITTSEDGQRTIHYKEYERGFAERTVPCTVDPPDWLQIPVEDPALFDLPGNG